MLRLAVAASFSLASSEALAIVRYMVQDMTCAEVQNSVDRDGVAILYRQASKSGVPLYDLYVSGQRKCANGEVAVRKGVPTNDREYCPVYKCVQSDIFVAR